MEAAINIFLDNNDNKNERDEIKRKENDMAHNRLKKNITETHIYKAIVRLHLLPNTSR